jgi:uncharacterized membrane protein
MTFKQFGAVIQQHVALLFLVFAVVFGLVIVFTIKPIFGNDELVHFPRAFQISEGQFWEKHLSGYDYGGQVPVQIKEFNDAFREQIQSPNVDKKRIAELVERYHHEKLDRSKGTTEMAFTSAGPYSPWSYLPSASGVFIAKVLNLPIIWYVYLARIACLLVWALLVYFAIRLLSAGKWFLIAAALLPTSIVQATTMGIDGIVTGVSWLIIALTIAVFTKKVVLNAPVFIALLFLSLFLATTKQGYLPIALLPLIIPTKLYNFNNRKSIVLRCLYTISLVLLTVWYLLVTGPVAGIMHYVQRPGLHVDSRDQLRFVFSHPLQTLWMILIQPFTFLYGGVYAGFVGVLTNRMVALPGQVMTLLYGALAIGLFASERTEQVYEYRKRLRIAAGVAWVGTFILINLALYITFTRVGEGKVEGVQGRYFLPIVPLLLVFPLTMVRPDKLQLKWARPAAVLGILLSLCGLVSAYAVIH